MRVFSQVGEDNWETVLKRIRAQAVTENIRITQHA